MNAIVPKIAIIPNRKLGTTWNPELMTIEDANLIMTFLLAIGSILSTFVCTYGHESVIIINLTIWSMLATILVPVHFDAMRICETNPIAEKQYRYYW